MHYINEIYKINLKLTSNAVTFVRNYFEKYIKVKNYVIGMYIIYSFPAVSMSSGPVTALNAVVLTQPF